VALIARNLICHKKTVHPAEKLPLACVCLRESGLIFQQKRLSAGKFDWSEKYRINRSEVFRYQIPKVCPPAGSCCCVCSGGMKGRKRQAGDSSNTSEKVSTNGGGCSRATINLAISAQRMKFLLKNFCSGDKVLALLVLPDSNQSRPRQSAVAEKRETHNENCVWLPVAGGGERERGREVTWSDFLQRLDAD